MIKRLVLAAAAAAIAVTGAVAQQDLIAARKELMKQSSAQGRVGAQMARGEAPYDQAKAQAVLATYADKAQQLKTLFPPNSRTGDTRALPAIWDKPADWNAAIGKFESDVKAAQASTKDLNSFKAAFASVGRHCGTCHEAFRRPQ